MTEKTCMWAEDNCTTFHCTRRHLALRSCTVCPKPRRLSSLSRQTHAIPDEDFLFQGHGISSSIMRLYSAARR